MSSKMVENKHPDPLPPKQMPWVTGVVLIVFGLLAAWFWINPLGDGLPAMAKDEIQASQIDPTPLRQMLTDPPKVKIGAVEQTCMDCHRFLPQRKSTSLTLMQHRNIHLKHGINNECLNCHDAVARDKLTLRSGQRIGFSQSQLLCAQCHGPTYRDWQKGMHGKATGAWDPKSPQRKLRKCVQCHNPHAPAFGNFKPLPGPHTLRMQSPSTEHTQTRHRTHQPALESPSPLQRWSWTKPHTD